MELILEDELAGVERSVGDRLRIQARDLSVDAFADGYGQALRFYLLLTHFPDALQTSDLEAVFYSRYYWFVTFKNRYQSAHGSDAGIEQQAFQILEGCPFDIDWSLVESVEKQAELGAPSTD